MQQNKKIFIGLIVFIVAIISAYFVIKKLFPPNHQMLFTNSPASALIADSHNHLPTIAGPQPKDMRLCPLASDLVKSGQSWTAANGNWVSDSPSLSNKVTTFTGAQWVGVKVGKVICLYQAQEANSFPIALQNAINEIVLEPKGPNWSAIVSASTATDRKLCKSVNVEDCAFYVQSTPDNTDIYKGLEYTGGNKDDFE